MHNLESKNNVYHKIQDFCNLNKTQLVVVSKYQKLEKVKYLYDLGQRDFGENRVQDLLEKKDLLPEDIRWHVIGTLQRNKVKYIAPFVHLIHSVDSIELLKEINKQAVKNNRIIQCLLQVHVASEETKHGFSTEEIQSFFENFSTQNFSNIEVKGIMGMATFTSDQTLIASEFNQLFQLFELGNKTPNLKMDTLSMGMSSDYELAIENHSNMIRVGSIIFDDIVEK